MATELLSSATRAYSERLAAAYRGLDALHRQANPEDRWGIVVLDLAKNPKSDPFTTWNHARSAFERLKEEAVDLAEADRRDYYADLTRSALTVIDWNERPARLPLPEQVSGFLAAEPRPAEDEKLETIRGRLGQALDAAGYSGELTEATATWEADTKVDTGDVQAVMSSLIAEAADLTGERLRLDLPPLPTVEPVADAPFNARCDFANNTIEINTDPVLTHGALRHLVVHEVFPGHCLQFSARRQAYAEGWGGADGLMSLVKSAGSPLFEGLADSGGDWIGWSSPEDEVTTLLSRFRAGLGTRAAWGIHHEGWTIEQARDLLMREGLSGGPGWVENRLKYISPHGRGAHIWSYWLGEQKLRDVLARRGDGLDEALITPLYGRMHSLNSLETLARNIP